MDAELRPPWLVRVLLVIAAAYWAFLVWFGVRLQVRVEVDDPTGTEPAGTLFIGRAEKPMVLIPASGIGRHRLEIHHRGGGEARVLDVRTVHNGLIPLSELARTGDWALGDAGKSLSADEAGSVASLEAYTSDLLVTFAVGPAAGRVTLVWNGVARELDLRQNDAGVRQVRLPSTRRLLLGQVSPWISVLRAEVQKAQGPVALSVVFGNERLASGVGGANGHVHVPIPPSVRWAVVKQFVAHGAALFLRCGALWIVFSLAGLVLLGRVLGRLEPLERIAFPPIVGFSLVVVLTTSTGYVMPLKYGLPLSSALVVAIGVALLRGRVRSIAALMAEAMRSGAHWRVEMAAALLGASILFFPVFLEGEWYLGHNFVDVYHYTNFGQAFLHRPYFDVAAHAWFSRFSDCVSLSVGALLLGSDTRAVFSLVGFWVWLTVPFAASALLHRLGAGRGAAKIGAVLLGLSASIFSLFTQSYWAHYLFMGALAWSAALAAWYSQLAPDAPRSEHWTAAAAVGAAFAFAISDYSFHFVIPLGWAAAALLSREVRPRPIRELLMVGGATALLVNVNVSVILFFGEMRRYYGDFKQVDAIARWVVFPFADSPEFAAIAYGLRDFVRNSQVIHDILADVLALDASRWADRIDRLRDVYFSVGFGLTAVAAVLTLIGLARCFARPPQARLLVGCTALLFFVYFGYLVAANELYGRSKLVMTMSGTLLPLMALGLGWLWEAPRARAFSRALVAAFSIAFVAVNLVTATLESADSFLNRKSELLYRIRSHLTVVDLELKELADMLGEVSSPHDVAPTCRLLDRLGSDGDRVLVARLDHLGLVGADGRSVGRAGTYEVRFKDAACSWSGPDDHPAIYETPIFRVFAPRDDGRGIEPPVATPTNRRW